MSSPDKHNANDDIIEVLNKFEYQLLSRLKMDCDYYLGAGDGYEGHLWAKTVEAQIEKMKELYNGFSDAEKPEWISMEDIQQYEAKMADLKKSKKEEKLYGISLLPEATIPYSDGYRYASFVKDGTGEVHLTEFFKTTDEVQQFVNENPEYGVEHRSKSRGR